MKKLILFDVDGTLAKSTLKIKDKLVDILKKLKGYDLGLVGGGNYEKIISQIKKENINLFKYIFAENGIIAYQNNELIHANNLRQVYTEEELQEIAMYFLKYIIDLDIPCKTGSFLIMRNGMWYLTPIGSNCNKKERQAFIEYDKKFKIRETIIKKTKEYISRKYKLDIKLGGEIGLGIHPIGWDKSYIMQFIEKENYDKIYFFGDRCTLLGNDYPLYSHKSIKGYSVKNPTDTYNKLVQHFIEN